MKFQSFDLICVKETISLTWTAHSLEIGTLNPNQFLDELKYSACHNFLSMSNMVFELVCGPKNNYQMINIG